MKEKKKNDGRRKKEYCPLVIPPSKSQTILLYNPYVNGNRANLNSILLLQSKTNPPKNFFVNEFQKEKKRELIFTTSIREVSKRKKMLKMPKSKDISHTFDGSKNDCKNLKKIKKNIQKKNKSN